MAGVVLDFGGELNVQCLIDNGAGLAPTDTPVGVWQLWTDYGGGVFTRQTSTAIDAELAKIAPNGNNLVNAAATFPPVPGTNAVLVYVRTSGGATARAILNVQK